MRTVVITDVHGCLDEFEELLVKTNYDPKKDNLLLLGDLVDRGPKSVEVVAKARKLLEENPNAKCIMGNHEEKHVRFRKHQKATAESGKKNPMKTRPYFMAIQEGLSDDDIKWMSELPLVAKINKFWVGVHAGFEPNRPIESQLPRSMLKIRYVNSAGIFQALGENFSQPPNTVHWAEMWNGTESVLYGHCVRDLEKPILDGNQNGACCLGLDTGCVFGGHLTAAIIEEDEPQKDQCRLTTVQVKAHQVYSKGWALGSPDE